MAFGASRKEWSELYTFFRLLSDGRVSGGTSHATADSIRDFPIVQIQREEHDGTRTYTIENQDVHIAGEKMNLIVPREDFGEAADHILFALKNSHEDLVEVPDGLEGFLDAVAVRDLEAKTEDRTDFYIRFYSLQAPLVGFVVRSRYGSMYPLLDGGRTANLKLEQSGAKFAVPTVNKINFMETANTVADRMALIERMGGILKYSDVADKVFRSNLLMIDLHFPRMLAEMVRIMHAENINKVSDLIKIIKQRNPLKIKDELIQKHGFYEYKMKQFLLSLMFGLRPAKIFNGENSAIEGLILMDVSGSLICYQKSESKVFADFLFYNSRLEKSSMEKDKYGSLEKENGVYYFKLNLKIGFIKK